MRLEHIDRAILLLHFLTSSIQSSIIIFLQIAHLFFPCAFIYYALLHPLLQIFFRTFFIFSLHLVVILV